MIYFASDIHLGAGTPKERQATEERFVAWLTRVGRDAEAIVLLGDLFDFWFEYKELVPKGFVRTLGKLAELHDRGVRLILLSGNHDMWIGDYLHKECGMEIYTSPTTLTLHGLRLHLAHGDNLRIKRPSLLWLMNSCFRSRTLRWLFRWFVHPDWALRFGHWWSGKSRKSHTKTDLGAELTEPLRDYARARAQQEPTIDAFLFGHMHVAVDRLNEEPRILHLGCWDKGESYATLSAEGELTLNC
uniref:UDP-2,3-diacylglucosamine diphosphatase n=1 Tax=Alistipes sp. TaxID=1872444 RepID=UPI004056D97D